MTDSMLQINFDPAFENIVDYIREKEIKNEPKKVSIWIKEKWVLDASNSGGVRLRFPLLYHVEAAKKEIYRFCPQFTVYLNRKGAPEPVNKGAVLNSIEATSIPQLLTHKDEKIRLFVREILASDPIYVQEFDSSKYFIEKNEIKEALKILYPSMKYDRSYNMHTLSNDIYDLSLQVDTKKVQKDRILAEVEKLIALMSHTEKFKTGKIQIAKYNLNTDQYNYYPPNILNTLCVFESVYRPQYDLEKNQHEYVLQYIQMAEELYEYEKELEQDLKSATYKPQFRINMFELMKGSTSITIRNQYDYRFYKQINVKDFNHLKEIFRKMIDQAALELHIDDFGRWLDKNSK